MVECCLVERAGGDNVVGAEEARCGGGEGASCCGGGIDGEGDACALAEGLGRGRCKSAAVEGGGGGKRERGERCEGLGAAAVGVGEDAAVGVVESDAGVAEFEGAGGEDKPGGGRGVMGEEAEVVEQKRRRHRRRRSERKCQREGRRAGPGCIVMLGRIMQVEKGIQPTITSAASPSHRRGRYRYCKL